MNDEVDAAAKPVSNIGDLSSRRFQQLADENRELKTYVADVMQRLRQNERLFSRMFELESDVLKSTDPEDLCFTLLRGLRSRFDLDFVRFWFERSSFLGSHSLESLSERDLVWVEEGEIKQMGLSRKRTWLVQLSSQNTFDWLTEKDSHLGSIALLTLGDLDKPFGVLGVGALDRDRFAPNQSSDFLQHLSQVVGLTLEHAVAREQLARLSVTDPLTGSHNRRFLQPHSHQPLSQWFGQGTQVVCLYADVDRFKVLNDELGHEAGDKVLGIISQILRQDVRANDPLIRMGGDEFVLLMAGCSERKAYSIAQSVVEAVTNYEFDQAASVSISIGVACSSPDKDIAVKALIAEADQAMYVAKALGGNRCEMAESSSRDEG